jgi:predicted DNA-binding transcriptional regulator AlpA
MDTNKNPVGYLRLVQIIGQPAVTEEQAAENRRKNEEQAAKNRRNGKAPTRRDGRLPTRPRAAIAPLIPVSKSTWWLGVASGRYPKPTRALGARITAWSAASVMEILAKAACAEGQPCANRPGKNNRGAAP